MYTSKQKIVRSNYSWMDFLHDPNNKNELFVFITYKVAEFTFQPNKAGYIAAGESITVSLGSGKPDMLRATTRKQILEFLCT